MSTEIAVTDAHALIWYACKRWKKLGKNARKVFEDAETGKATIYVPTIALVEVLEAAQRGLITFAHGAGAWVDALFSSPGFFPVDLTTDIVVQAEALYAIPERGDRLIAATAAHLGFPLITRDPEMENFASLPIIW